MSFILWWKRVISKLLNSPLVLRVIYNLFAPGWEKDFIKIIRSELEDLGTYRVLEVGSGPGTSRIGCSRYVGIDIEINYLISLRNKGIDVVQADARRLPFKNDAFDVISSFGVFHHLCDEYVIQSLRECYRVVDLFGKMIMIDNIYPTNRFNFLATIIRKLDRGKFVRTYFSFYRLFQLSLARDPSSYNLFSYTRLHLEGIVVRLYLGE